MNLEAIVDSLTRHKWTDHEISKYIGDYQAAYFGYASDHLIRSNAASGGVTTAILAQLLENQHIDGALVCVNYIDNNTVRPKYIIAKNREELLAAQGSKYISGKFSSEAMMLIREFVGRLAVVALPCDAKVLRTVCLKDETIDRKVALIITLFCGHLSQPGLTDLVVKKLSQESNSPIKSFRYRSGAWRGSLMLEFGNGKVIRKKFSKFSNYQNLYYFCERKCLSCYDHIGFYGDIAVGDVWLQSMKKEAIKHSCLIVKTLEGEKVINSLKDQQVLKLTPVPITTAMDAQVRSLRIHCNISPRVAAAKKFGFTIQDPDPEKFNFFQYQVANIILKNALLTQSKVGADKVSMMSNFSLKAQLYFLKALQIL